MGLDPEPASADVIITQSTSVCKALLDMECVFLAV